MFDWAQDHRRRLALWIFIALVLHTGAYFLFRVVEMTPSPSPSLDTTIYVLPPNSPEARRLAPLIASEDPSLAAADRIGPISVPDPPIPKYRPGYATASPRVAPLPDPDRRLLPPVIHDFGAVTVPDLPSTRITPTPATRSMIEFGGELAGRDARTPKPTNLFARPEDHLPPATFLVKIDKSGRVLHVLEQEGTQNRELDAAAMAFLSNLTFSEGIGPAWGTATFHWGNDIQRVKGP